jgi:hypothetical protein
LAALASAMLLRELLLNLRKALLDLDVVVGAVASQAPKKVMMPFSFAFTDRSIQILLRLCCSTASCSNC